MKYAHLFGNAYSTLRGERGNNKGVTVSHQTVMFA
jgi:hypothetical protein